MDNHAGPAAAVAIALMTLARENPDEAERVTALSIEAMLTEEYNRHSKSVPVGKNLSKQASGLLSVFRKAIGKD